MPDVTKDALRKQFVDEIMAAHNKELAALRAENERLAERLTAWELQAQVEAKMRVKAEEALAAPVTELWALCYLHDWDPPKEGQEHRWEPGKNVFPEIHAFYRTWQEAEAVKRDMGDGANKYWVVRARPESHARLDKVRSELASPQRTGQ